MEELEIYLQNYFGISQESLTKVAALFEEDYLKKDAYYIKSGQYCTKLSFVRSGFLRVFALTETKEITQWISFKDYFITDISGLYFGVPARWNIQALTDCAMYTISREHYQQIGNIVPEWDKLEKFFLGKCFATLEDRVFSFLSMTAEERYQALFQFNSELFNEVPLHYLASMMGMSPETLSRIRKKLAS